MTTTDQPRVLRSRAWKARLLSVNLVWVLLAVVYAVVRGSHMNLTLVYLWVIIEFILGATLFVLGVLGRPR